MTSEELHAKLERKCSSHGEFAGFLEDGSERWHEFRNQGIGASSISVAMGMNPFQSAVRMWADRTGRVTQSPPSPEQARRFWLGHAMEPVVSSLFEMEYPRYEVFDTGSWRSKQHAWMTANPDRILYNEEADEFLALEIKTSNHGFGWGGVLPPFYYLAQVRQQLAVLGLEWGYLAVLIGNEDFKVWKIPLNHNEPILNCQTGDQVVEDTVTIDMIVMCGEGFMNCVANDIQPTIDGSVSAWQTVIEMNPDRVDGSTHQFSQEEAQELLRSKEDSENSAARFQKNKSNIYASMGTAHRAFYRDPKTGSDVVFADRRKSPGGKFYLAIKR